MRRTAFRRPAYVPPLSPPLRPVERTGVMVAVDGAVVAVPKVCPVRAESYRRWIASLACFCCGIAGWSQCAHANGGGMGTKASDLDTFPLCATRPGDMGCHMRFDLCIDISKAERRALTERYVKRAQALAREAGRQELKEAA